MIVRLFAPVHFLLIVSFWTVGSVVAQPSPRVPDVPNDQGALNNLSEVKIIFDVTTGNPDKLLNRLDLVESTQNSIVKQGRATSIILAFRQEASLLVQKDFSYVPPDERNAMQKVQDKIRAMGKMALSS